MKILHDSFMAGIFVMWKFQIRILKQIWDISRHGRTGPCRVGPVPISVLHRKRIFFCSMSHIAKNNIIQVMMLFLFSHMTAKEGLCVDRWDASRRITLLRSQISDTTLATTHHSLTVSHDIFLLKWAFAFIKYLLLTMKWSTLIWSVDLS